MNHSDGRAEKLILQRGIAKASDVMVYLGGGNLEAVGKVNALNARRVGDTSAVGS